MNAYIIYIVLSNYITVFLSPISTYVLRFHKWVMNEQRLKREHNEPCQLYTRISGLLWLEWLVK